LEASVIRVGRQTADNMLGHSALLIDGKAFSYGTRYVKATGDWNVSAPRWRRRAMDSISFRNDRLLPPEALALMRRSVGILILTISLFCGCTKPPLTTKTDKGIVQVSVMTLGEYPTSISRLQLVEKSSNTTVWEVRAQGSVPQIWGFDLREGHNPRLPDRLEAGRYRVLVPSDNSAVVLRRGTPYTLKAWNKTGSRSASTDFQFP
jgi:hypothetical protein